MNIIIERAATIKDTKQCNKMLQKMLKFEYTFDHLINPDFKVKDFFQKCLTNTSQILLIAKNKEKVVGFLHGFIKQMPMQFFREGILQLNILFVEEEYRNLQIGTKLIDKFTQIGKENKFYNIEVSCITANTFALNFYKNKDFKPIHVELRKRI